MSWAYAAGVITQSNGTGKSITSVASTTGGITVTVTGHGYSNGNFVEITGTTDYNGAWIISNVTTNTFDIVDQYKDLDNLIAFTSTQTGTVALGDSDISGISGLTGVTTTTTNEITYYIVNASTRVVISGALLHKSKTQVWVILYESSENNAFNLDDETSALVGINIDGIYQYGEQPTVEGVVYRSEFIGMFFRSTQTESFFLMHAMRANGGGRFAWYSNWIYSEVIIGKSTDNTGEFWVAGPQCRFIGAADNQATDGPRQIRFAGNTGVDVNGLTYDGNTDTNASRIFANQGVTEFAGIEILCAEIQQRNGEPCGLMTIKGLSVAGNRFDKDVSMIGASTRWTNANFDVQPIEILNVDIGTGLRFLKGASNNCCATRVGQEYQAKVVDSSGDVQDCIVYLPSTDNGNERTVAGAGNVNVYNSWDPTSSIYEEYDDTTDANGETSVIDITLMFAIADTTTTASVTDIDYIIYDETGVKGTDQRSSYFYSYLHNIDANLAFTMQSASVYQDNKTLVLDSFITQTTRSTVAAYTTIDDVDELCDRHKDWKCTLANIANPSLTTQYLNGAGLVLAIGDTDLVIDSAAGSAFAVNTAGDGTITVKPTSSFGNGASTFLSGLSTEAGVVTVNTGNTCAADVQGNLTLNGTAIMSGDLTLGNTRVATIPDLSQFTGAATIENGGRLDIAQLTSDAISGAGESGGRIKINGSSNWIYLDLRGFTVSSGFAVENSSGNDVIILQNTGDTAPTLVTTSGGLSILTGINTDTVIRKNGANYEFYQPIRYTVTSGGSPVVGALVGWFDNTNTDRTYTDGYVNGALTTDGSGVVDGLVLFRVDTTTYTGFDLIVAEPGYQRIKTGVTENVSSIDAGVLLTADAFYTSSPSSNTTVTFSTATIDQAGNDTTQGVYDYYIDQWLGSATNMWRDQIFAAAGSGFEICCSATFNLNSGTLSGSVIAIDSGTTLNANAGSLSCGANVIGTLAAASQTVLTGTINMQGGTLDLADLTATQMTGDFSSGTIDLDSLSAPTTTVLDLKAVSNLGAGLTVKNDSNEDITVKILPSQTDPTLDVSGPGTGTLTIDNKPTVQHTTLLVDSYVRLYNQTQATELDLQTLSGAGYSFDVPIGTGAGLAEVGDTLELQVALYRTDGTIYKMLSLTGILTDTGLTYIGDQVVWTDLQDIHAKGTAFEGPNVTGFTLDVPNIEIDITVTEISGWKLATWLYYQISTTAEGIRNYFNSFISLNIDNMEIDASTVDLKIDNNTTPATFIEASWVRNDGDSIVASGSATIQFQTGLKNVVAASGSKDTAIDDIKTQTDKLQFDVANQVSSNMKYVKGQQVTGSGTAGDPWGP